VLIALGLSTGAAAGLLVVTGMIVLWAWIIVDGFRAARREGRSLAGSVGHGLWELQDFWFPSGRASTKLGRRIQGRQKADAPNDLDRPL
jgi:hypothetical protein